MTTLNESRSNWLARAFLVGYVATSALVGLWVRQAGGIVVLGKLPKWTYWVIGPMLPLGVGHGVEFFVLGTFICVPLVIAGIVNSKVPVRVATTTIAAFVWASIGGFLAR